MTTDETSSIFWLWISQIAWWLVPMLPLVLSVIIIVLGFRWLNRRARAVEAKPVEPGYGGFLKTLHNKFSHMAIGQSMLYLIAGGLALGGILTLFLQSLIQPAIEKAVEQGEILKPETAHSIRQSASLDLILFLALVLGAITVVFMICTYRSLRQRASQMASQVAEEAPRPLLVRWFHDSKKIGLLATMISGWFCFGLLMQVVGLIVFIVPLPESLANLSFPWAATVLVWVFVVVMGLLLFTLYAPAVWMAFRDFKLDIRYYQGNSTFRMIVNVGTVFAVGAVGALVTMRLLSYLGTVFWPSVFH
jgi:hypothetical protein